MHAREQHHSNTHTNAHARTHTLTQTHTHARTHSCMRRHPPMYSLIPPVTHKQPHHAQERGAPEKPWMWTSSLSWSLVERNSSNRSNLLQEDDKRSLAGVLLCLRVLRRDTMYREMSVGVSEHTALSCIRFSPLPTSGGDPLKVICGPKVDWLPMPHVPSVRVMTAGQGHLEFSLARGLKARALR